MSSDEFIEAAIDAYEDALRGSADVQRRLVMIATGVRKARCVERAVRGPITTRLPASFLQVHPRVELFLDVSAASLLV